MERMKILHGTDPSSHTNTRTRYVSRADLVKNTHQSFRSLRSHLQSIGQSLDQSPASVPEPTAERVTPTRSEISTQSVSNANVSPELDPADVKHTQTESMASNDAAVNTGTSRVLVLSSHLRC